MQLNEVFYLGICLRNTVKRYTMNQENVREDALETAVKMHDEPREKYAKIHNGQKHVNAQ